MAKYKVTNLAGVWITSKERNPGAGSIVELNGNDPETRRAVKDGAIKACKDDLKAEKSTETADK
ncbi:hypothetical protein [Marivivens aquimaris]|uniref:hypothetical protein n=1 Tax=Marivivens aquimaris TaxID=2774876 RepID=UPI00187FB7B9|nr:hypothetical protein [Marivivens aquimaris]